MLFSITKAVFATLALGVAVTSAAPASANDVARRSSNTVADVMKTYVPQVKSGCDKLNGLGPNEVTPAKVAEIVAEIDVSINAANDACKGASGSVVSAEITVIIQDLLTEITGAVSNCKKASGNDPNIIAILAKIDISLSGLLATITGLVSGLLAAVGGILAGLLGGIGGLLGSLGGCGFHKTIDVLVHVGINL